MKVEQDIRRINLAVANTLARKVEDWRRRQSDLPNMSEAIRRLIEQALEQQKPKQRSVK
jgi:metal-responsive CopG/Arc/MetJ family transcriptional regulator